MCATRTLLVEGPDDEHVLKHVCGNRGLRKLDEIKPLNEGYTSVPPHPLPDGTIVTAPAGTILPRVGVWIMPNNQTEGVLEDFLRFLVPHESALLGHVESSITAIPAGELRFLPAHRPKAVIHTWLAWQAEPGKPLGVAITARYLDPSVAQVDVLVAWLTRLFFS